MSRTELAPRVANPNVQGRPRPVDFTVGSWFINAYQIGIVVLLLGMILAFCIAWRRNPPGHPVLLMAICTTLIVWQDPIMNWAPFAVYNPPDWLHWPEDWPLISMSPTVEPFFVFSYAIFYLVPYFPPGIWITRKLQAKGGPESFAARHPLVTLALVVFLVVGFVYDMIMEVVFIRTGMYIYSQVIPFGSLWPGTTFQFPLLWESLGVTFVMIPPPRSFAIAMTRASRSLRSWRRRRSSSRRSLCWAHSWSCSPLPTFPTSSTEDGSGPSSQRCRDGGRLSVAVPRGQSV